MKSDYSHAIQLLGPFQLFSPNKAVRFRSKRIVAMLSYLICVRRPITRVALAELIWPDKTEKVGRTNIRWAVNQINQHLPNALQTSRDSVAFAPPPHIYIDIYALTQARSSLNVAQLEAVLQQCQGQLLDGFFLDESADYETWLQGARQLWWEQVQQGATYLIDYYLQQSLPAAALNLAHHLLSFESSQEIFHQLAIQALAQLERYDEALTQFEYCRQSLEAELGVEPSAKTIDLYHNLLRLKRPRQHNLPSFPLAFVGRTAELSRLDALMSNNKVRLITISGSGGMGKTRLAVEAAKDAHLKFVDGVVFVPLAAVEDVTVLAATIIEALVQAKVINPLPETATAEAHLQQQLLNKNLLLVLDNFEHLIDGAPLLTDLIEQAPDLKLLVTSRQRLPTQWEHELPIQGLPYPEKNNGTRWLSYDGIQIFLQTAKQAWANFEVNTEEQQAISRICQLVEGMPLALIMAARWVGVQSCGEILSTLEANLASLTTSATEIPVRQRSMQAVFDYSWAGLHPNERQLLPQLAVFRGGFSLEATMVVANASLAGLNTLLDKSLIQRLPTSKQVGKARFVMHELLRRCSEAKQHVNKTSNLDIGHKHSRYYLTLLQTQGALLDTADTKTALITLTTDIDNIRAAWSWAVQHQAMTLIEKSTRFLAKYYRLQGWFSEAAQVFDTAWHRLTSAQTKATAALAWLRLEQARVQKNLGAFDIALDYLADVTAMPGQTQPWPCVIESHLLAAEISWMRSQYEAAQSSLNQAQTLFEQAKSSLQAQTLLLLEGEFLRLTGLIHLTNNRLVQAGTCFEQTRNLFQQAGHLRGLGLVLNNLGMLHFNQEAYDKVVQLFEEAQTIWETVNDHIGMIRVTTNLNFLHTQLGNYDAAQKTLNQAAQLQQQAGGKRDLAQLYSNQGILATHLKQFEQAEAKLNQGLQLRREIGDRVGEIVTWGMLAILYFHWNKLEKALKQVNYVMLHQNKLANNPALARLYIVKGYILARLARWESASEAFNQANALQVKQGGSKAMVETTIGLAMVDYAQQNISAAAKKLNPIIKRLVDDRYFITFIQPLGALYESYVIFQAAGEQEIANRVLQVAYQELRRRTATLNDASIKTAFVDDPMHQRIINAFQNQPRNK